ncbi:efflux RND transporter periplasmic adaptor subunit [Stenomitos frigidus]|uniref:Efflux transporter periplasmic adaptor subunit n=1 Tax=Stenomitos frigidus ULC18 TaxID=2107698 RepID=A0A2T1EG82_9CYAN|nr:efflux RND transporter periplasmic adaptor subunit [Stenomitos frigidus]PSB31718.1 efflux transporter periplasmic adaptor subunit [Stenomitos frigidus ULC18]
MTSSVHSLTTLRSHSSRSNASASVPANLTWMAHWSLLTAFLVVLSGCNFLPKDAADAQTKPSGAAQGQGATAVDVAIAATAPLEATREYTGTTQPLQEVAIRAQAEGQLRQLKVDVGDRVQQGQTLAQIDDSLLKAATTEAESELAARRSEISQLQTQVSDARTQVEQSRLQLQQAESDAARYEKLARDGAVTLQQAEQARTQAKTAAQVLRSSQEKVRNQQQAIVAANGRIVAQQAVVAQQQERRSYAVLTSPINGAVLTRSTEQGNLVQVGNELLRLGDFSRAKVTVQVSELGLAKVRLGGAAKVRLDAFPNEQFAGTVTRVSPAANPTSRLIPVEVTIPNSSGKVGSGLLARVSFTQQTTDRVVVPIAALQDDRVRNKQPNQPGANAGATGTTQPAKGNDKAQKTKGTVFVVTGEGEQAKVAARSVALGKQADGNVQVLTGLNPGDRYVARTSRPLKGGDSVRLSILSAK